MNSFLDRIGQTWMEQMACIIKMQKKQNKNSYKNKKLKIAKANNKTSQKSKRIKLLSLK